MNRILKYFLFLLICTSCKSESLVRNTNEATDFKWEYASPQSQGFSSRKLEELVKQLSLKNTKKLLIIKNDKIVCEWAEKGFEDTVRGHYTASMAKAIVGGVSLLAAMNDGYIHPDDLAAEYIPEWRNDSLKSKITIRQLATHTSGMEDASVSEILKTKMKEKGLKDKEDYTDWKRHFWSQELDPFLMARDSAPIISIPGKRYMYSNPGIGMLTYAVTSSLKGSPYDDIRTYLKEKIYEPIGIGEGNYQIGYGKTFKLDSLQLVPSWGGGTFRAADVARIGRLMLRGGNWQGKQLIDPDLVREVISYRGTAMGDVISLPRVELEKMRSTFNGIWKDYRTEINPKPATTAGWYCNFDRIWKYLPQDAFAASGAGNQLLLVVPSLDLIVVRFGGDMFDASKGEESWYGAEKYLFNPVIEAIIGAPYPQSKEIAGMKIDWSTHQRRAPGSDNFPLTWADDDNQYGIWGDGGGFAGTGSKYRVALGVVRIEGDHKDFKGYDRYGHKESSEYEAKLTGKSWGIICVKGTLYAWIHPDKAGGWGNWIEHHSESRLYLSKDKGASWQPAGWAFTPEDDLLGGGILQFGKNYQGARDKYVYNYFAKPTHPLVEESAGTAKEMRVPGYIYLARVNQNNLMDRSAYEFFAGYDRNVPLWTKNINEKEHIFFDINGVATPMGISYNIGLKKYLLTVSHRGKPHERGQLGVYESPSPWGPWSTITYSTDETWFGHDNAENVPQTAFYWCFPTKWMSRDGRNVSLNFSGGTQKFKLNDSFNTVRVEFLTP